MATKNILMLLTTLLAIWLFLATASDIWAVTYYIDFVSGADTNNGTSTSTPWRHSPGDPNATNVPTGTTPSAGDTLIFKGGVKYNGYIIIPSSGSAGSPITFDGNSAGTFGTGQAILDGGGTQQFLFVFQAVRSYITITNFELRNANTANWFGARAIYDQYGSNHIVVSYCTIHGMGSTASVSGEGISLNGSSYWDIHDNSIYDCYSTGIELLPASYCNIHNNNITDKMTWGIRIRAYGGTDNATENNIYNNSIHDIYYFDGLGPHTDFIFLSNEGPGTISNTSIYNNLFYNNHTFTDNDGTAFIYVEISGENGYGGQINNTYIYNNVFYNCHAYNALILGPAHGTMTNAYICNNSFYGGGNGGSTGIAVGGSTSYTQTNINVKNNAINSGSAMCLTVDAASEFSGLTIDYNCHYSTGIYQTFKYSSNRVMWAAWQAAGYDAHGMFADPKYINTAINTWNLRLQSGSPAMDTGTALGPPYNVDLGGNTRPIGARWDIGAYEYSLGSSVLVPQHLRILH